LIEVPSVPGPASSPPALFVLPASGQRPRPDSLK
jgi:hypothetical protein